MRPINLIPAEERRGEKAPLRAGPVAYVIVGVLALALMGITALVLTGNKISDHKDEVASLKSEVAAVKAQAEKLTPYTSFAAMQQAREETVTSLAQSRFNWERALNELAIVIPDDVWLTNVTAKASADSGTSTSSSSAPGVESIAGPLLDIQGCSKGHEGVAKFLAALRDVDGVTRVTVVSSDRPKASGSAGTGSSSSSSSSTSSSSGTGNSSISCSTRDFISTFEVVAAFDNATPTSAAPVAPTTGDSSAVPTSSGTPSGSADSQPSGDAASAVVSGTGSAP
ncbi:MAG: hypothetical protein E6G49_02395 [Actinobacteria bacterium]|nr:MAG: hypothetical protein E6G49_02395 [Actinomycetota bacterium]